MPAPTASTRNAPRAQTRTHDLGIRVVRTAPGRSLHSSPHPGFRTLVPMFVFAAIVLPLIIGFGSLRYVSQVAQVHDTTPTDAIVVLGAAQYDGRPSPVLKTRLEHAKDLVAAGVASRIITVGGGIAGDRFTEAGVGRRWLIDQGLASDQVVAVEQGHNTLDSLTAVAQIAQAQGWSSVTIASDPAHIARSLSIAHRLGFEAYPNPTESGDGSRVTEQYLFRETGGYLAFQVFDQWSVPRIVER